MRGKMDQAEPASSQISQSEGEQRDSALSACPVCGGHLLEIRAKFQCERCHRICETCCEGGRG